MKFELTVLGTNSAVPTSSRFPSSHLLNVREKLFLIDCGEGTQMQLRKQRVKFSRLNHIFISHMHGDHVLGLPGLVSTLGLLGRTADLHIHANPELEKIMDPLFNYFGHGLSYKIVYHHINPKSFELIHEDKSMTVHAFPLNHRVPCYGFLFREKELERNIIKDYVDYYKFSIKDMLKLKAGEDFISASGDVVPNSRLTSDPPHARSYAYCTDTRPLEEIVPFISGVDLLYHEATFGDDDVQRLAETYHSSARQAAGIAKKAKVKQLLIGHYSSRYKTPAVLLSQAKEVFIDTIAAKEGMCLPL